MTADTKAAEQAIGKHLAKRGYEAKGIEKVTPLLEDIFVFLIEVRDREYDAAKGIAG